MAEFTPITTQEEFDAAIKARLERQEKAVAARYEGALPKADADALRTGYEGKLADLTRQIESANGAKGEAEKKLSDALSKIKQYETDSAKTRIALEMGIPYALAGRLNGETEEEIRKDAEALRGLMKPPAAPLASPEPGGNADEASLRNLLRQMRAQ